METCSIPRTLPVLSSSPLTPTKPISQFSIPNPKQYQNQTHWAHFPPLSATLNGPRGFGPSPKKTKRPKKNQKKKKKKGYDSDDEEKEEEEEEEGDAEEGIDVPNWVPFIVSFVFFGTALAGVSYGIVSSSWDPLREGSLLGWTEARKNWPVFWQSLRGRSGNK
ncbi:hypothetical protein Vadar_033126 [Vaccinium darrowii]|uniref:Uncharacterized protein n=1 Tax=Vaccinium darrowii TaxID=229202 RepID=A0ACB7X6C9_9ERIC|nr:hypothetical protein Vadar_033126 [Vaccinium darrowii]